MFRKLSAKLVMLSAVASLCPLGPSLVAQTDTFTEVIEVRVVNLEVVVTDGRGNRVADLEPEDFRLRVDGQEVPIGYFTEILDGRAVTDAGAANIAEVPGVDNGKAVGTSYLVFIDDYFTITRDRNQILQGILDSLAFLGPEDRMAVVAFDGKKLEMLTSWSQSRDQLERALTAAMGRKTFGASTYFSLINLDRGFQDEADMAAIEAEMLAAGQANPPPPPTPDATVELGLQELVARNVINQWERDIDRAATAVTATLRSFARPPGRKVMLLLSGGWPESPVHFVLNRDIPVIGFNENKGPRSYDKIHDTANLLGYTLYPIDVPPQQAGGSSVETGGIPDATSPLSREREIHSTLFRLAEETGGTALLSGNRVAALDRVVEDTRSYYWLGFTPEWQGDDENHKIQLDVLKPGLKVRHREGYQDLSRTKEVSFMVESALMFGELPGSLPLGVDFGEIKKAGAKRMKLPLEVTIPMDAITMLPRAGEYVANLELRVASVDKFGDRSDMPVIPVKLQGPKPQPGQRAVYVTELKLRNVTQDLVVSLHDPVSGTILATTRELRRN